MTDWGEVEIYLERPHNSELELQLDSGSDTLVSVARTAALPVVTVVSVCDYGQGTGSKSFQVIFRYVKKDRQGFCVLGHAGVWCSRN